MRNWQVAQQMLLGKQAIWEEITFDPDLAQFDIMNND